MQMTVPMTVAGPTTPARLTAGRLTAGRTWAAG